MCGRFALAAPSRGLHALGVDYATELQPRYNIAPSQPVAALVRGPHERELTLLRWGLVPSWARDLKVGFRMFNARSETAHTKPAFRAAFKKRRALILADGFYEWKRVDKKTKIPHLITATDNQVFAMAGLWEQWTQPSTGEVIRSCTVMTTEGNALMKPIHDRMPVIVPPSQWDAWLDTDAHDPAALQHLLRPAPAAQLKARPVSRYVNNARHEGPDCWSPYDEETA
jgi:putative SOS response-associated peptidase YedK